MTVDTAASALAATARNVMDRIRYMVLGTIDENGCTRTSPVYFVPRRYRDLYWVSTPTSHHSHNLKLDNRLSAVIFDSTVPPSPDQQAVCVSRTALEVQPAALAKHPLGGWCRTAVGGVNVPLGFPGRPSAGRAGRVRVRSAIC